MTECPGYEIHEVLHRSARGSVARCVRTRDGADVIVKQFRLRAVAYEEFAMRVREYELLRRFDRDEIASALSYERFPDRHALILRDTGGSSLDRELRAGPLAPARAADMAADMLRALDALHSEGIVHLDINPSNIIVSGNGTPAQLVDFDQAGFTGSITDTASRRPRDVSAAAYFSPEQTGRTRTPVDNRSDLYSFGVTLFEALTATRPFTSDDASELFHLHLAKTPPRVTDLRPELPDALADFVARLLEKSPSARFPSARAAGEALDPLLRELGSRRRGVFPDAAPAAVVPRFPDTLFGRDAVITWIERAAVRSSEGAREMILLTGEPGIGKTAVLHRSTWVMRGEYSVFALGRFDAGLDTAPYSGLKQALRVVALAILGLEERRLRRVRAQLRAAAGSNAATLLHFLPELETVLGAVNDAPGADIDAARRVSHALRAFLRVASAHLHLVLALDDLHNADAASVELLGAVLTDEDARLLILAACDEARMDEAPGLSALVRAAEGGDTAYVFSKQQLGGLTEPAIHSLLCEALGANPDEIAPLARLMQIRTGGSPLEIAQLLQTLHAQGALRHDTSEGRWVWDAARVSATPSGSSAAARIALLPAASRELLWWCACAGMDCDAAVLAVTLPAPLPAVLLDLQPLLRAGLLLPDGEVRAILREEYSSAPATFLSGTYDMRYRFAHESLRQSVLNADPQRDVVRARLRIGRAMLRAAGSTPRDDVVFDIAAHLHAAAFLIDDEQERLGLVRLSLRAARFVRRNGAADAAVELLRRAEQVVESCPGDDGRALARDVQRELAEGEYQLGQLADAEQRYHGLLARAAGDGEYFDIVSRLILLCTSAGRYGDAIDLAARGLARLGAEIPTAVSERAAFMTLRARLPELMRTDIEGLVHLPDVRDENKRHVTTLLEHAGAAALLTRPPLYALMCLEIASISMQHGNTAASSYGYSGLAALYGAMDQAGSVPLELAEAGIAVARRFADVAAESRSLMMSGGFVHHWFKPAAGAQPLLETSHRLAMESGNRVFAGYSVLLLTYSQFFTGLKLEELLRQCERHADILEQCGETRGLLTMRYLRQIVVSLLGRTSGPGILDDDTFDTFVVEAAMQSAATRLPYLVASVNRMRHFCVLGRFEDVSALADTIAPLLPLASGMIVIAEYHFYRGLAAAVLLQDQGESAAAARLRTVVLRSLRRLEGWMRRCPANFEDKWTLITAELAAAAGDTQAQALYDRAVNAARNAGFLHMEALACERAARHAIERGDEERAHGLLLEAVGAYEAWGALPKAAELRAREERRIASAVDSGRASREGRPTTMVNLDTESLLQAVQAISSEIMLPELMRTLMRIVLRHAGAERGALLSERQGDWRIDAEATINSDTVRLVQGAPLSTESGILASVVRSVARTGEVLVLQGPALDPYRHDPAYIGCRPRSVLCLPLRARGALLGILYLDHCGTEDVFPDDILAPLRLLTQQIAISLHNAQLYRRLEDALDIARDAEQARRDAEAHRRISEVEQQKNREIQVAYDELQMRQQQLIHAEKMASLGELTAGVAHEIQNPMNFMITFADVSRELLGDLSMLLQNPAVHLGAASDDVRAILADLDENNAHIRNHGQRVASIVRGMELHARKTSGAREDVPLRGLLEDAVQLAVHGQLADTDAAAVEVERKLPPADLIVHADAQGLVRVFLNLLQNAFHAAKTRHQRDGTAPCVAVSAQRTPAGVEITIDDSGGGVPAELREKVFQPFFTTKPSGTGTGLGLSLSYEIVVKGHRGALRVEDGPLGGARFVVVLPAE
ncbi:MAG: AAA family ATPase [Ignavibacteriae bacterium]|nr:AAA family ATPase [Ignavibacteriota bacterium]